MTRLVFLRFSLNFYIFNVFVHWFSLCFKLSWTNFVIHTQFWCTWILYLFCCMHRPTCLFLTPVHSIKTLFFQLTIPAPHLIQYISNSSSSFSFSYAQTCKQLLAMDINANKKPISCVQIIPRTSKDERF